jgi:hypothetical protein
MGMALPEQSLLTTESAEKNSVTAENAKIAELLRGLGMLRG